MESKTIQKSQRRHLLLDSRIVDKNENVRLAVGKVKKHPNNPVLMKDKPREIAFGNMYPSIIYDKERGIYICYTIFLCFRQSGGIDSMSYRAYSQIYLWKEI